MKLFAIICDRNIIFSQTKKGQGKAKEVTKQPRQSFKENIQGRSVRFTVQRRNKPMEFRVGQPVRTSSPEMVQRSTDSSIDEQYAAALPTYSQLVTEDRYANYVSLTFTSASMWWNKSMPSGGPSGVKLFGSGEPHIVH